MVGIRATKTATMYISTDRPFKDTPLEKAFTRTRKSLAERWGKIVKLSPHCSTVGRLCMMFCIRIVSRMSKSTPDQCQTQATIHARYVCVMSGVSSGVTTPEQIAVALDDVRSLPSI